MLKFSKHTTPTGKNRTLIAVTTLQGTFASIVVGHPDAIDEDFMRDHWRYHRNRFAPYNLTSKMFVGLGSLRHNIEQDMIRRSHDFS